MSRNGKIRIKNSAGQIEYVEPEVLAALRERGEDIQILERRPQRRQSRPPLAANPANQAAIDAAWERQQADARRIRQYRDATSRPEGTQEAGHTTVDGRSAYYEDGGSTGATGRRERYYGPNGPFGPDHHHDTSFDGGETWENWH